MAEKGHEFSVAMTASLARELAAHLDKGLMQEDLTFAVWRPSEGQTRTTAVLNRLLLPRDGDRVLQGNVAFTSDYLSGALSELEQGEGLALLHSHLGPGWQGMSSDDIVAERDRLASACFGRTSLPIVGLTRGTDGAWSARRWLRADRNRYERENATTVRVVGRRLAVTFHPRLRPPAIQNPQQVATVSVWGDAAQADLARIRVAIIGLGSVGSLVAEALARMGVSEFLLVDDDRVEERNLDRTAGATESDADRKRSKVDVSARHIKAVATSPAPTVIPVRASLLELSGMKAALDADVIFSCVDRPWPRHVLNGIAYNNLIPVVDGGVLARVDGDRLAHVDWRIHTVGPERACMVCIGALDPEDISLDVAGKLDDPDYVANLPAEKRSVLSRRNVYPFSMAVAAHEALQFVGLITGLERIGGVGPQSYHAYPGIMEVAQHVDCKSGCGYQALTGGVSDLRGNLEPSSGPVDL